MDQDPGRLLSISAVAEASGLRASALRYYEEAGLITPAERHGGRRHYDPAVVDRLACISLCQDVGFSIAEIRELLADEAGRDERWEQLARRKLAEIDEQISAARTMRELLEGAMACTCHQLEGCDLVEDARHRRLSARQRPA